MSVLGQARAAVSALFFVNGALFATWAARLPSVREHVHARTGALGLCLLGMALGALVMKPVAGRLVARLGSALPSRVGLLLNCAALPLPGAAGSVRTLAPALVLLGATMGLAEVAMNAQGLAVQRRLGRSVLSSFHGLYSTGGLVGALTGGAVAGLGAGVLPHFLVVAAVLGAVVLAAATRLLPAAEDAAPAGAGPVRPPASGRPALARLLVLGAVGFCALLGEGATADWSAIHLREDLAANVAVASWGYAAFALAMVSGRLAGDPLIRRLGGLRLVSWSALVAGCGFGLSLLASTAAAGIAGYAVLGLGLSVVIPVLFSAAGRVGGAAAAPAISIVSSLSGLGFLAGPPAIGFLAQAVGLTGALWTVPVLALTVAAAARHLSNQEGMDHAERADPVLTVGEVDRHGRS